VPKIDKIYIAAVEGSASGFVMKGCSLHPFLLVTQGQGSPSPKHSLPERYCTKPPILAWRIRKFLLGRCSSNNKANFY
jgi:hypothetical protein